MPFWKFFSSQNPFLPSKPCRMLGADSMFLAAKTKTTLFIACPQNKMMQEKDETRLADELSGWASG